LEAGSISAALEEPNGGFDFSAELPQFGDPSIAELEEGRLGEALPSVTDELGATQARIEEGDCVLQADADGNGAVNTADWLIMLTEWNNEVEEGFAGDLNQDLVVNTGDLLILLSEWGQSCIEGSPSPVTLEEIAHEEHILPSAAEEAEHITPERRTRIRPRPMRTRRVFLRWGHVLPRHPRPASAREINWSGIFRVSHGQVRVLRTVSFEEGQDRLPSQVNRNELPFISFTQEGSDGVILEIREQRRDVYIPQVLYYQSRFAGPDGLHMRARIAVDDISDTHTGLLRVAENNGMLVSLAPRPGEFCPAGSMSGIWRSRTEDGGVFFAKVHNRLGEVIGHLRGYWGEREDGSPVFFGKQVDLDGAPMALIQGQYRGGRLRGEYETVDGSKGSLQGYYRYRDDGLPHDGLLAIRWRSESCEF